MRVGLFTDTYFPQVSGVATSIRTLKTELEKQGYQVNVRMQGLGENKAIRQLYMEHIKAMLKD